jgi:hypothetical protein
VYWERFVFVSGGCAPPIPLLFVVVPLFSLWNEREFCWIRVKRCGSVGSRSNRRGATVGVVISVEQKQCAVGIDRNIPLVAWRCRSMGDTRDAAVVPIMVRSMAE